MRGSAGRRGRGCSTRRWRPAGPRCRVCPPPPTEAAHPVDWATTQNSLGVALRARSEQIGGEAGAGLRRGGGGLPRRAPGPHRGGAPSGLGEGAEQPRQRAAGAGRADRRGGGGGVLGEAMAAYRAALPGLYRGGAPGGLGDDAEQPRRRVGGGGRAGRRGGGGGAARRGGGGLPRRAPGPYRGGAPGGLGEGAEQPRVALRAQGARGGRRRRGLLCSARRWRPPPLRTRQSRPR